jgi:arylsulfatase A-like enzyme
MRLAATLAGVLAIIAPPMVDAADERPNIILFLVDDLGWQDSEVSFEDQPSLFQQHYRTPNLLRLASRGVRFDNAYAHCVCSPTRTSIMTGQNPARHHVTNWTLRTDQETSGTTARLAAPNGWRREGIQPGTVTLPERLRSAGYRTIHVGKAHWGAIGTLGSDPCHLGFDINIAGHAAGAPGSYQGIDDYGRLDSKGQPSEWAVPGLEKYYGTNTHLTDALAREATAAIDEAISDQQPFFLYMATYAVHAPLQPHPRFMEHYRGQKYPGTDIAIPENEACYASMVEGYDAALGAILDRIRDRNVADRTILIFTSDNGGLSAHARGTTPCGTDTNTHNWPLREGKGSAYEGGIRVPLVVSWATPDSGIPLQKQIPVTGGSVCRQPVVCEDLMPTICHWAGVAAIAPDQEMETVLDGRDWTPLLRNTGAVPMEVDRPLVFHYPHVWGPRNGRGYQPHSALRLGNWKVIYFYDSDTWELYDLSVDIGEASDLAAAQPDKLAELAKRLIGELDARQAQYPTDRQTGQPVRPLSPSGN